MKKNIIIYLAMAAIAVLLASCGDDDPVIPRDRDVTMNIEALTHVSNASTGQASVNVGGTNTFVFHPKTLTLDMKLNVALDGSTRTFSISGVPVKAVDDTFRYTFDQASCSNAEVTNLKGTIDVSDPMAIMQCDIAGRHVCITLPDIFFHQTAVGFTYSDGTTSSYGNSYWSFPVSNNGTTADITINNLEIARDLMVDAGETKRSGRYLSAIIGHGAKVTATTTGLKITAEDINTVATYGNGEQVAAAYQTDNYPIVNLMADVNLSTGTLNATFTLRHILARDQANQPTEWDDISVTASGIIFRQSILN